MCRWLRRGGRGESQKPDLNEREWPLALLYGVRVWQQSEQRPLWLIGLIWQQGKKKSLWGPSGYSFHHLSLASSEPALTLADSPFPARWLVCSLPHFTFSLYRFNNCASSSNQGGVGPSKVTLAVTAAPIHFGDVLVQCPFFTCLFGILLGLWLWCWGQLSLWNCKSQLWSTFVFWNQSSSQCFSWNKMLYCFYRHCLF